MTRPDQASRPAADSAQRGRDFQSMHLHGEPFIMANAWNPGTAILLAREGFRALATTSAGMAYGHGLPDYAGAYPFEQALVETRAIVEAVDVPVSMDAENGYADDAEGVNRNMARILETGVAGAGIEDHSTDPDQPLYDIELAAERIAAAKQAVLASDRPFVLTARAECYLVGHDNPFEESVRRVNRYREAGADCLFVPGVRDIDTIRRLVAEVDGPVSVVMGLAGAPLTRAELASAGVARISIGGSLARATLGLVRRAAREMLDQGSFDYAAGQIPDAELCELFLENS